MTGVLPEDSAEIVGVVESAAERDLRHVQRAVPEHGACVAYPHVEQVALRSHSVGGGEQPYEVPLGVVRPLDHIGDGDVVGEACFHECGGVGDSGDLPGLCRTVVEPGKQHRKLAHQGKHQGLAPGLVGGVFRLGGVDQRQRPGKLRRGEPQPALEVLHAAEIRLQQEQRVESRQLADIRIPREQHFRAIHDVAYTQVLRGVESVGDPSADDEHVALAYHAALAVHDVLRAAVKYCHQLVEILMTVDEQRNIVPAELNEQRKAVVVREIAEFHFLHSITPSIL